MSNAEKISDAEWKVMQIVWKDGPLPSADVVKALTESTDWNPKTIHTFISRLVKKGILGIEKGQINMYYALISENDCKKEVTDSFIKKVYNGSIELLVSNFVKSKKLSKDEIEDLKKILDNETK